MRTSILPLLRPAFFMLTVALCVGLTGCDALPKKKTQTINSSDEAQKTLDALPGPAAPSLSAALEKSAQQANDGGHYKNAVQFYKQLLDKDPNNKQYRMNFADALRKMGSYPEAVAEYEKLRPDPEFTVASTEGAGLALMGKGDYQQAGDYLAKVMELDAARWRTINAIGLLFTIKNMYPEARQYYAEALVVDPQNISVRNNQGIMEAMDHQYDESIRLLKEASNLAVNRKDDLAQVDLNMALVYAIKGDLKNAEAVAKPHLTETQLLNNMGFYAHLSSDDKLAMTYLNMALNKSPAYYEKAWENLGALDALAKRVSGKHTAQPVSYGTPVVNPSSGVATQSKEPKAETKKPATKEAEPVKVNAKEATPAAKDGAKKEEKKEPEAKEAPKANAGDNKAEKAQ